jgi:hypothetical protein
MSNWVERHYRFRESQDPRWEAAFEAFPDELGLEVDPDWGRFWIVKLPVVAATLVYLTLSDHGAQSLGDGWLLVTEDAGPKVRSILRDQTRFRGRWWSIRRAHFATPRAQKAFEALL